MNKKPLKIIFAPGCFDDFEGTQEELDEFVKLIQEGFADGSLLENAEVIDEEEYDSLFGKNTTRTIN